MRKQQIKFSKVVAEGSHYEIGEKLSLAVKQNPLLRSINLQKDSISASIFKSKQTLLEEFCPGVMEEIAGLTDALSISPRRLTLFSDDVIESGGCSHFVALPNITKNGHSLVGRSYEYTTEDELCLCLTRITGKVAQIGFSLFLFGRFDGMNEQGLTVTMSSCEFGQYPYGEGLWFPFVIRSLLDHCTTVEEATYRLRQMPIRSNVCLLMADTTGDAAIAETACFGKDRKVSIRKGQDYLIATNHYQDPNMSVYDKNRRRHSTLRYKTIEEHLLTYKGGLSQDFFKRLLEQKVPIGIACPYYEDGLGTLHAMVFDVTERKVEVCLGAADIKKWEPILWNDPEEIRTIPVVVQNEYPENPEYFWHLLEPGRM